MTECALCRRASPLRRSHILPEFLYATVYDNIHRLQVLSTIPERGNWREQKGLREALLCDECEQRFSVWERYASLLLKGGVKVSVKREHNLVMLSELNYEYFRLFQLSVLWRAGVSSLEFFRNVRLGRHEAILRRLLLDGDPGPSSRYCCVMFGLKFEEAAFTGVIMQPLAARIEGQRVYKFVFGGFMWVMFVAGDSVPAQLLPCTLQPPGNAVFVVKDATEMRNLASFSEKLTKMGRAPS